MDSAVQTKMAESKRFLIFALCLVLPGLPAFSSAFAQGTLKERLAERRRTKAQEKQQDINNPGGKNYTFSLQHGGMERTYVVHVPTKYDEKVPVPLLLAFHGYKGTAEDMKRLTLNKFDILSESDNFIAVYPNGIDKSWNVLQGDLPASQKNIDDVGFVRAMIADIKKRYNIDSRKIYSTGMSNGGYFSNRLGCEASDLITAIAPVSGEMPLAVWQLCRPQRPLPVVIFHGTKDPFATYAGGKTSAVGLALSAEDTARFWAGKNSCASTPVVNNLPEAEKDGTSVTQISYTNCKGGADVVLFKINNGGHSWPGGWQYLPEFLVGKRTENIDAAKAIWSFFLRYSK